MGIADCRLQIAVVRTICYAYFHTSPLGATLAMNNSFQPPHSLCIVLPTWVGDACMATPTLRAIRQAFPDSKIVGVMRPVVRDVLEHAWGSAAPWLDEALLYSKKSGPETCSRWGLVGQIRRRGVDLSLIHISEPTRPY